MGTPLVEAEQDRSIQVEDLAEGMITKSRRPQTKEALVPLETGGHTGDANGRPALHTFLLRPNAEVERRGNANVASLEFGDGSTQTYGQLRDSTSLGYLAATPEPRQWRH
jgi:hypothetical protein